MTSKNARGETFVVPGLGKVVFFGHTPHGWPLFKKANDPPYFGQLTVQGEKGERFNRIVAEFEGSSHDTN